MERIYDQAKDKNVAAIIIYGKSGESSPKAYTDSACTKQFKTSELKDAFLKRAVVQVGSDIFMPISYTETAQVGTVTYAKVGSTAGTAATATVVAVAD